MNNFLCKLFIKNYEDTNSPEVRERYGKFAGIIGVLSNTLLCLGKLIAGILSGSIAIIADSINNLTDASSSLITLVGFKLASRPEDEEHPYGHARYEYIAGIAVAMLIIIASIELLKSSLHKIFHPEKVEVSFLICGILIASILIKVWQATFNINIGKKIDSLTLSAAGADSRNDVISTSAVLIGLLITKFTGLYLDGFIGTIVALFIFISGIGILKETVSPLLGEAPDRELVEKIRDITMSYSKVVGIHDLIVHNYGPGKIFASIHIEVDADDNLLETHDMIDTIEQRISKELNIEITAHMDPIRTKDPLVQHMYAVTQRVANQLQGVSHIHDLRIVPGNTHTNVIFDIIMSPDCPYTCTELHDIFEREIQYIQKNYFVRINFDKAYTQSI